MKIYVDKQCLVCIKRHTIDLSAELASEYFAGLELRESGMPIQEALPFLNNSQLELIISGLCDKAFAEIEVA
jgi:hypothetical protein